MSGAWDSNANTAIRAPSSNSWAFLGSVGAEDMAEQRTFRGWSRSDEEREQVSSWLPQDGDLTGYLYRCPHCGSYEADVDAS